MEGTKEISVVIPNFKHGSPSNFDILRSLSEREHRSRRGSRRLQ